MLMKHLLALGEFASNAHRDMLLSLEGFVEEIERTTANEVDFTQELGNLVRFHGELANEEGVPRRGLSGLLHRIGARHGIRAGRGNLRYGGPA